MCDDAEDEVRMFVAFGGLFDRARVVAVAILVLMIVWKLGFLAQAFTSLRHVAGIVVRVCWVILRNG